MSGFTGIPGQTRAGAKAYADALSEAYQKKRLAHQRLQPKRSRPNAVARAKYEAIDYWDRKARAQIRKDNYGLAFGAWTMKQLAKLHSESWGGLALDVATLGTGGLGVRAAKGAVKGAQAGVRTIKALKPIQKARAVGAAERYLQESAKAGEILVYGTGKGRYVKAAGKWGKVPEPTGIVYNVINKIIPKAEGGLARAEKLIPKYIEPITIKGRKIVTPRRAVKAGGLAYRGVKTERNVNSMKATRLPDMRARPSNPYNIRLETVSTAPSKPPKAQLPKLRTIRMGNYQAGMSPVRSEIGDFFKSKYMDKVRKYNPPFPEHKPNVPPPYKHVTSKPASGVGTGSRPFNWKSNAIPPKHLQSTFMPDRPGQPGWGLEVRRSRPTNSLRNMWQQGNRFSPLTSQPVQKRMPVPPMRPFQSNPSRQMSQGLMNPNRARPMTRPPMFR